MCQRQPGYRRRHMTKSTRTLTVLLGSAGLLGMVAAPVALAQMRIELVNDVGATAPCVGIGLGMAIVKKCATWEERDGFLRTGDVGMDGLTIGTEGQEDGGRARIGWSRLRACSR